MSEYQTVQGDTWDIISLKNYQSEMFTDVLMAANFDQRHIAIFPAGITLQIPEVDQEAIDQTNLPPWRRG